MSDDDDRYLRLPELAAYSTLSVRTLQRCIAAKVHPLPAHRLVGRALVVKRSEFDQWVRERESGCGAARETPAASRVALDLAGYRR